ncbi:T9SS type A sorting domain-containing protein [Algoriphagus mannitolivorans]|uniref:T9SS type A sorting domain-containing protein n=1 Tax=Algoriphagus mannitolivorans TaxID=226504 RepID=UPI0004043FB1|nr:T9SS type A sorting domain-containing protein [Algoriphagus mannitolivorans]
MDRISWTLAYFSYLTCRIYRIFLAVGVSILLLQSGLCQEINSYKTIATGDFPNPAIWAVWNGSSWNPASTKPSLANDIYIDQTHTLRLVGNEQVKSVFINAETGAGQKLNLNGFNLDVFGTLQAFSGPAPGMPDNAWNSQNWIGNSISSTITFKGNSRTIIQKNSWSAQTTQSRFSVIFDPNPGQTLTLESPLKALQFTVKAGNLLQKLDTSVLPNVCNTLSFNTETTVFGTGPFGNLMIESGATMISECNSLILNRSTSGSVSALNFILKPGGILILEGSAPRIEAANYQLNGKIIFRSGNSPKSFLSSSYPDAGIPNSVGDVVLQSNQNLQLPAQLFLNGNLEKTGVGNFLTNSTHLVLTGSGNQEIIGFPLVVRDLTLNKSGGTFFPRDHLTIQRNLALQQGQIDFQWKELIINTSGLGSYTYSGGKWKNLGLFTYQNIPLSLNGLNSTFPFEDSYNGGVRKVQLLGNTVGGNLSIRFTEYKGAEHDPGFDDNDGTPILYRLFSFFQFSGFASGSLPLQVRLSADQLIVDNVDDLRVVGTGYPLGGTHVPGIDPVNLWAVRDLTWNDLSGKNVTIGSYRVLSILPVIWLETIAKKHPSGNLVTWKLAAEKDNMLFEIFRTEKLGEPWALVGVIPSEGNTSEPREYRYIDEKASIYRSYLYQIRQVDLSGESSWSKVFRTFGKDWKEEHLLIYPNPFISGSLHLEFPEKSFENSRVLVRNTQGQVLFSQELDEHSLADFCQTLPTGVYIVTVYSENRLYSGKLIKR